jgi:hypothetical protein
MLTHEIVGKTTLGIGLDETPRWGYLYTLVETPHHPRKD